MTVNFKPEIAYRGAYLVGEPDAIYTCNWCHKEVEGVMGGKPPSGWHMLVREHDTLHFCSPECYREFTEPFPNTTVTGG